MTNKHAFLSLQNLSHTYGTNQSGINNINLHVAQGEFHCLLGRSGCGKSTLLKLTAGLLQPSEGQVYLQGLPLVKPSSAIGFVFQQATLLDWLTVLDNVLLPASLQGKVSHTAKQYALHLLHELEIATLANRYPSQLSGGQQSRVAIARALLLQPALLLMDEPFAALDALTREQLQDNLLHICQQHNNTVLFVTHDIEEAIYLADQITVLEQGRLYHQQSVNLVKPRYTELRHTTAYQHNYAALRHIMEQLK